MKNLWNRNIYPNNIPCSEFIVGSFFLFCQIDKLNYPYLKKPKIESYESIDGKLKKEIFLFVHRGCFGI